MVSVCLPSSSLSDRTSLGTARLGFLILQVVLDIQYSLLMNVLKMVHNFHDH